MGQQRYHNYLRPLTSLEENFRIVGITPPGIYAGFDRFEIVAGNLLKMKHDVSGAFRLKVTGDANDGPFGTFITNQGVVVYDDTEVQQAVPLITTNPRIDLLIATHTFLESSGGAPAVYSIIQGAESANPVAPTLSNPLNQILLGYFKVSSAVDHTTTVFIRAQPKKLGGEYAAYVKESELDLRDAHEMDFNKIQKTGVYSLVTTLNRPSNSTSYWTVMVNRKNDKVHQMAFDLLSGRIYVRASLTVTLGNVLTWSSWLNLNNADVPGVNLTPIYDMIGSLTLAALTYTEQNYVTNAQSLKSSIDILDMSMKDIDIILDQAVIDINNLETAIGDRLYDENNIITDGESISDSLNKFDKAFGFINNVTSRTLDNALTPGIYNVASTAAGGPARWGYNNLPGHLYVTKHATKIYQRLHGPFGAVWWRSTNYPTIAWSAWVIEEYAKYRNNIGNWNMNSVAEIVITNTFIQSLVPDRIKDIQVTIFNTVAGNTPMTSLFDRGAGSYYFEFSSGIWQLVLTATPGGRYDTDASFAGTGFNRGNYCIECEP